MKKRFLVFFFICFFVFTTKSLAFSCQYQCDGGYCDDLNDFVIDVDEASKNISISRVNNGPLDTFLELASGTSILFSIDDSISQQWFESSQSDKCSNLYLCHYSISTTTLGEFATSVLTSGYEFYYDDGSARNSTTHYYMEDKEWWDFLTNVMYAGCGYISYSGEDETLTPEEKDFECGTMDNAMEKINDFYQDIHQAEEQGKSTAALYKQVNDEIDKLEVYCHGVLKSLDWSSQCVKDCTQMEKAIADAKVANHINSIQGDSNSCNISERLAAWLIRIVSWVRYIVPVAIIILTILDFIKAIAADNEDEIKKVSGKFAKRLIVALIIFLLPLLLEFILGIFGQSTYQYCLK